MCALCDRPLLTRRRWLAGFVCAGLSVLDAQAQSRSFPPLLEPRLRIGPSDAARPVMALTLDACSGQTDMVLLEALITRQVPATLFLTALWMQRNPHALSRIKAYPDLFAIGNHGGRHAAAIWGRAAPFGVRAAGSPQAVLEEVHTGEQAIADYFGSKPRWFRGATALYSADAVPLIAAQGYAIAGYSLNGDAGASLSATAVTHRLEQAVAGDVILAHLNHPERPCGRGLVAGLDLLLARGVRFTHLDAVWQAIRAAQL